MLTVRCCYIVQQGVLYSGGEFPGLKMTVLANFWAFLSVLKRHYPLHIGLLSPQICTEHRGVKNPWKIGRNPPIGGKESTLLLGIKLHCTKVPKSTESLLSSNSYTRLRTLATNTSNAKNF